MDASNHVKLMTRNDVWPTQLQSLVRFVTIVHLDEGRFHERGCVLLYILHASCDVFASCHKTQAFPALPCTDRRLWSWNQSAVEQNVHL